MKNKTQIISIVICALLVLGANIVLAVSCEGQDWCQTEWREPTGPPSAATNVHTLIRANDDTYQIMEANNLWLYGNPSFTTSIITAGGAHLGIPDLDNDGNFLYGLYGRKVGMGDGIGTSTPFAALEIFGEMRITGAGSDENTLGRISGAINIASTGSNSEGSGTLACTTGESGYTDCVNEQLIAIYGNQGVSNLCGSSSEKSIQNDASGMYSYEGTGATANVSVINDGKYSCPPTVSSDDSCTDFYVIPCTGCGQPNWRLRNVVCKQNGGDGYSMFNDTGVLKIKDGEGDINLVMTQSQNIGAGDAGNIGIGISNPKEKLSVEGVVAVKGIRYPDGIQKDFVSSLPAGAISFFNLTTGCPDGWTQTLSGRYLVNTPSGGTLGQGAGSALTQSQENRPTGEHGHDLDDPWHSHGYKKNASSVHRLGNYHNTHRSDTMGSYTTGDNTSINAEASGVVLFNDGTTVAAGTPAPYIQYFACKKD